ncbi:hypothetical protein WN51_08495 [Melipona quadrifasciata]|uniref:Uncharacterized protein n=1 Tax=Melipona quadrifasciata TaxID=166423 RepID=A0A0M9A8P4_9HYME|nr:hypothetical protein WN51_08495 [Melipona quadrifasciata]
MKRCLSVNYDLSSQLQRFSLNEIGSWHVHHNYDEVTESPEKSTMMVRSSKKFIASAISF